MIKTLTESGESNFRKSWSVGVETAMTETQGAKMEMQWWHQIRWAPIKNRASEREAVRNAD